MNDKMKIWVSFFLGLGLLASCSNDKYPLPIVPDSDSDYSNVGKEVYNLVYPIMDSENGYHFSHPADIYFGVDNFIYICDTDNDRIVMMDAGGAIQGYSQTIEHPEAITQNDSLALLIVNKTNQIFKIDLFKANHIIAGAEVKVVYTQVSEPTREFTGITIHKGFEYYVTVVDVADSSDNYTEFNFIYDFNAKNTLKGTLPLFINGTGLYSTLLPTSIVSIRERYLDISSKSEDLPDFWFTQTGRTKMLSNSFKIQSVTSYLFEGQYNIRANTGLIGSDIYDSERYWNPEDIALDHQGYIFVVDAGRDTADADTTRPAPGFYRFSSAGTMLQSVIGLGAGDRSFNHPKGIAVSPNLEEQTVYIADTGNNRIVMFKLSTQ
ncbi:MAG: hypothetical protein COT43_07230 [Candidatus Marinimicrobia bacterium CG08_land_8_20_14_0_20_45_22]|nr:MAG: hypothetical protein COT43_07230 [Candidatus Marinimicrobia bacterium CG08_land_8_20_14_0_20_45_22]